MATVKLVKKLIQLVIKVPNESQWDFIKEFNRIFRLGLNSPPLLIEKYLGESDACYITISLFPDEEQKFYDLCKNYFHPRGIKTEFEIK